MSRTTTIAADEWRYWFRSRLAISVLFVGLVLAVGSALLTASKMSAAAHERAHLQIEAEETFYSQPDRHPHRMVHYGHYVFRTPPPLSIIDPGVDAYTGTSIFLEGHRQNSAMFADRQSSAGLAGFGALTPAFLLQTFAPLLLILMGYNVITREREARALHQLIAQGLAPLQILTGKGLALAGAAMLMLSPLLIAAVAAIIRGETAAAAALFASGYAAYLLIWCALIVLVSAIMRARSASLGALLVIWMVAALLLPPLSSTAALSIVEAPGKIETDFAILEEMKKVGDGHNAADPAFASLRANLLQQYNVDSVEELPMNFRGVVAQAAEAELTDLLNRFAEDRMQVEVSQAHVGRIFGWFSPVLGVREFSMTLAGVDLETHHRFLREAEELRFDFVQSLNKVHAEKLAYADDISRSSDPEAEKRTRMSAENWKVLNEFRFEPAPARKRIEASLAPFAKLLVWLFAALALCATVGRRVL
ncbi:MAG: DUF3526 domain-containing protein [Pseudomonadota bacterium]